MPTLDFRRATPADAETLGALHSALWRAAYTGIVPDAYLQAFTPEKRTAFFARTLPVTPNENYILSLGGEPAGMLAIGPTNDERPETGFGEIHALYLFPEHWGHGHGRRAMNFALERLRSHGFTAVSLWVLEENARARRFYEAYGFLPDGAREPITLGRELMELRYTVSLSA